MRRHLMLGHHLTLLQRVFANVLGVLWAERGEGGCRGSQLTGNSVAILLQLGASGRQPGCLQLL